MFIMGEMEVFSLGILFIHLVFDIILLIFIIISILLIYSLLMIGVETKTMVLVSNQRAEASNDHTP